MDFRYACRTCPYVNSLCKQCGFNKAKIFSKFYPFSSYRVQRTHVLYSASMFKDCGQPFACRIDVAVNDNSEIADIVHVANGNEA